MASRKKQNNSIQSKVKALNNNFVDLTKTGPLTGRQLQQLDPNFRELPENAVMPNEPEIFSRAGKINYTSQPTDFGNSHWDPGLANANEFEHYQDVRANNQPWYSKAINGLAKGAVLAGTTFLDGTIGLLTGIADMTYTAATGGNSSEVWSRLWDNPFSRAMQNITDWTEENMPNYYTEYEQEHPFTFNTNWFFDKFIKNLGFTIGAVWSGGIYAAPFKIARVAKGLQVAGKAMGLSTRTALKVPSMVSMATGTLLSATSEGRVEAINNSRDHARQQQEGLDEGYAQLINSRYDPLKQAALQQFEIDREMYGEQAALNKYNQTVSNLDARAEQEYANRINDPNYQRVQSQIEKDRLSFGNADLAMNLPILTVSHAITFGKVFGGGYKTARRVNNALKRAARPQWEKNVINTTKILKGAASEGTEEIIQRAASDTSGYMYGISDFHKALTDPKGEKQGLSLLNAISEGMKNTFTDPSAWEEFAIGALTGLAGVPMVRSRTREDGTKQSPIYINGGFYNEFKQAREEDKRAEEIADYVNNRLKDPKTINYYRGLIRHNKYQNDMDEATENGNIYDYKNAQHAQLISDITMFDNAGELDTLKGTIKEILDTSDDNLDALVTETSAIQPDGTIAGPYAKYATIEDGKIVSTLDGDSREELRQTVEKRKNELLGQIKDYNDTKDEIDIETGENFTDDQLKELTYLGTVINDRSKRASKTFESEKDGIRSLAEKALNYAKEQAEKQSKSEKNTVKQKVNKAKEDADKQENKPLDYTDKKIIQALETIANASSLEQIQKASKGKFGMITNLSILGRVAQEAGLSEDPIIDTMHDISNLTVDSMMYEAKLAEFKANPDKLQEETNAADTERADEINQEQTQTFRTKIQNAKKQSEILSTFIQDGNEYDVKMGIIEDEATKGNLVAQNFLKVDKYHDEVEDAIDNLGIDDDAKERAKNIFAWHIKNSENLDQATNTQSQFLQPDDPTNSQDIEDNAHVLQAMQAVAAKRKTGQSFSSPAPQNEPKQKSPSTLPATPSSKPKQQSNNYGDPNEPVVGESSQEHSAGLNQQINNENPTINQNQDGQYEFWKPTVTEVPIDCDKTGNFTPTPENKAFRYLKTIYDFLKGQGNDAFNFLDEGGVKVNDNIEFVIDPNLEQQYKDDTSIVDYKGPTILFRHKSSGRIIGNVPLDTNKYVGLTSTIERINKEYSEFIKDPSNKDKVFVSKETTKVRQILPGKLKFTNEWRVLSSVNGFSLSDVEFALINRDNIITSNVLKENISLINTYNPGTLYVLLKNPAGTYTPVVVNVAHFNREELSKLKDSSRIYDSVFKIIDGLFSKEIQEITNADLRGTGGPISNLNKIISCYDLMFNITRDKNGVPCLEIGRRLRNKDGNLRADKHEHKYYIPLATDNKVATFAGVDAETSSIDDDEIWGKNENGESYVTVRSKEDIVNDVMKALIDANVPIQVTKEDVKNTARMKQLTEEGVLTTNLESTHFYNTWFTTDYIDEGGQQQKANILKIPSNKPKVPKTSTSKSSTVDLSTLPSITYKGIKYYIDRSNHTIYNEKGQKLNLNKRQSDKNTRDLLFTAAYAFEVYGDARNGVNMIDHKLLVTTDRGKVRGIDLDKIRWLSKEELNKLQEQLAGKNPKDRNKPKIKSEAKKKADAIINKVIENQQKVDRNATTSESYSILEDDGQYHLYDRVHKWLGDNYEGDRSENRSTRSLDAGNSVDSIVRAFFNAKNNSEIKAIKQPDNMSYTAFKTLIVHLMTIKDTIDENGETFYANNIVVFHKYADGTRIAGEVDILSVTADGKFKIYDMKTSKSSFYTDDKLSFSFITPQQYGTKGKQKISTQAYYTQQLSAYKNLFESEYDATIDSLALMPFQVTFDNNGRGNNVKSITPQKGIILQYDPNTPVKFDKPKPNIPSTSQTTQSPQRTANKSIVEDENAFNTYTGKKLDGTVEGFSTQDGEMQTIYFTDGTTVFKGSGTPIKVDNKAIAYFTIVKNEEGNYDCYYVFNNGSSIKLTRDHSLAPSETLRDSINQNYVLGKQSIIKVFNKDNAKYNSFVNKGKTLQDVYKIEPQQTNISKITDVQQYDSYNGNKVDETSSETYGELPKVKPVSIIYNNNGTLEKNNGYPIIDSDGNFICYVVHSKIDSYNPNEQGEPTIYGMVFENGVYFEYRTKETKQFEYGPEVTNKIYNTIANNLSFNSVKQYQKQSTDKTLNTLLEQDSANPLTNNQTVPAATPKIKDRERKQGKNKLRLREATKQTQETWSRKRELNWAKKNLPKSVNISIVKGLIRVAEKGATAWGSFCDNIITLSDVAARGTTYHEAFHAIFDNYLTAEEQEDILREAREKWPGKSYDEIMENLAEDFREYTQTREDKSLLGKIKDFFIDLFYKVTNWKTIRPSMNSYFRMINAGRFSNRSIQRNSENNRNRKINNELIRELPIDYVYRYTDINELKDVLKYGDFRRMPDGVIVEGSTEIIKSRNNRRRFNIGKEGGQSHGGKAFAAGLNWIDTEAGMVTTGTAQKVLIGIPGKNRKWRVGHHGGYSQLKDFNDIKKGEPLFVKFDEEGDANIPLKGMRVYTRNIDKDGNIYYTPFDIESLIDNSNNTVSDTRYRLAQSNEEAMTKTVKRFLSNFDIRLNEIDEFDSNEPLFDALNRVINIKNADDITDGTGYAIAFMMQHSPLIKELISLHQTSNQTFKIKGIRRSIRKRGEFTIDDITRDLDKNEALKEIGKDIAVELRKFYNLQSARKSNSYISKIWEIIKEFFNSMTHRQRTILKTIQNNTVQIANAIILNDSSIIRSTLIKPGTTTKAERVNIGKALKENPYEDEIIRKLQKHNIALAGSASIALSGTLFRPSENPLHDIDFEAEGKSKEEMDTIIKKEFPHSTHIRTIDNDGKPTQTYLILDREFTLSHTNDSSQYFIKDKNGNTIGSFIGSELVLAKGVKGKFLDFFTGKSSFGRHAMSINNKTYLINDYRNAMDAKINWAREKDIWDYNNFVSNTTDKTLQEQRIARKTKLREKLKKARVIWAHPAIGKTTYLEKNHDILEWDDIVNPKRNRFIKQQLDPNNIMDENSQEYKDLKQQYMADWVNHPEYVEFLTNEWNNLIARAKKEDKRVFASPLPLLDIGANDIDLIVALNNRDFTERNQQRGGSMYGSRSWKQAIDATLSRQDPNKIEYTGKYFSDFMRENLGVHWGTLTSEEEELLKAKGFTEEEFESMSQLERDKAVECAGL